MELLTMKRCDDCRHTIADHDYMGCTRIGCDCSLDRLFLMQFHKSTNDKKEN